MANLVAGRQVVPELMQDDFTPDAVAKQALPLLAGSPDAPSAMRADLRAVRAKLGAPGASRRAAEAVLAVAATERRRNVWGRLLEWVASFHLLPLSSSRPSRSATVLVPAEFSEIVGGSEIIAYARVVDVRPEWADGRRWIDSVVTAEVVVVPEGRT